MPEPIIIKIRESEKPKQHTVFSGKDFAIEDIVKTDEGNYDFIGLDVPEGRWDVVTLAGEQYPIDTYAQCIAYSNAQKRFKITPAKVRYWLKRGAYELRDTKDAKLKSIVTELKALFKKDGTNPWQYNAESVSWVAGQDALVTVKGWPADHPFAGSYHIPPSPDNSYMHEIIAGCGLDEVLEKITGDSNPQSVKEVFEWVYEPSSKKTYLWRLKKTDTDERCVGFGVSGSDYAVIDAYVDSNDSRAARGVAACAKNFHRK